jgi:hypothetical protein
MAADFAQGHTPNYAYITPAGLDDAHDGTLEQADQWLQANVPAILARPEFGPGSDGITPSSRWSMACRSSRPA